MDREKNGSLLKLIKEQKRKLAKKRKRKKLKDLYYYIYYPSKESFLIILVIVGVFLLLSKCIFPATLDFNENHYQNLIAIHAGIGTIIFALIIFTAESMRDDQTSDRARVLLRENFLFPLTVAEILTFFIFIWGPVNLLVSVISILIIGVFAITSLGKTITVLLNRYKFFNKRIKLLKDRLSKCIEKAIDERLGNNIFITKLYGEKVKLRFDRFWSSDKNREAGIRYIDFKCEKFGVISDIDLKKLLEFSELLENQANKNGFSYERGLVPKETSDFGFNLQVTKPQGQKEELIENKRRFILKGFHDRVTSENDTLISVDGRLVHRGQEEKLNKIARQIFKIKEADNFSEEVHHDLSGIKDQFLAAIKNKRLGLIKDYIEIYTRLAESFLENMEELGHPYSHKQALQERSSMLGGWTEIRWLIYDIRDIYDAAMATHQADIIIEISFLPIRIMTIAIKFRDHFLFQEFIQLHPLLYPYALKEKDDDIKKIMIDRSWRYLKEISDFHIKYKVEGTEKKEYAIDIYYTFQTLLKKSFDKKDIDSFKKFRDVVSELFPEEGIKPLMDQMLFGLASYIFDQFKSNKDDSKLKAFYNEIKISLPDSIEKVTEVFLNTHDFDVTSFWKWGRWYLKIEDKFQWVPILEILERFYVVRSLEILESTPNERITQIELPHSHDLVLLADGARELIKIINDISDNKENWRFVLSDEAINRVPELKRLLDKAKNVQEEVEKKEIRKRKISSAKVSQYKDNFIKNFYEYTALRGIFKYFNLFRDDSSSINKKYKIRLGLRVCDDKAAFFDNWHAHYLEWGTGYGLEMASGENRKLLNELSSHCNEQAATDIDKILERFESLQAIFIIANSMTIFKVLERSDLYKPKHLLSKNQKQSIRELNVRGFSGYYEFKKHNIPVFEHNINPNENIILVFNKEKFGELVQYSPLSEDDDKNLQKDIFYINIRAFSDNDELVEELLNESPDWLKQIGDKEKQRLHLLEHVLVEIYQKFEFKRHPDFEGYLLRLIDNQD